MESEISDEMIAVLVRLVETAELMAKLLDIPVSKAFEVQLKTVQTFKALEMRGLLEKKTNGVQ